MHTNGIAACIARDTERQIQSTRCQHSSKRLTTCPHQTHTHTHTHPTHPPAHQHSSTASQQCGIVRNSFAIASAHDEPERHRCHAPLDCLTAQIHVYLPGRCCQHRLPHPDHSTRTHRALEANRQRRSQERPYTHRRGEGAASTQTASQHALQETERQIQSTRVSALEQETYVLSSPDAKPYPSHQSNSPAAQHRASQPCGRVR